MAKVVPICSNFFEHLIYDTMFSHLLQNIVSKNQSSVKLSDSVLVNF